MVHQCGVCEAELPTPRVPTSVGQAMWGGWSCGSCGSELDAVGRPLASKTTLTDRVIFRSGRPPSGAVGMGMVASILLSAPVLLIGLPLVIMGVASCTIPLLGDVGLLLAGVGPLAGAVVGFSLWFAYTVALGLVSAGVSRRGRLASISAAQLEVDDIVLPFAEIELVGEGSHFAVVHRGRRIPLAWAPGLEDELRGAYTRFQDAQTGADEETRRARAKLASLRPA